MKRPLFAACLCVIAVCAVLNIFNIPGSSLRKERSLIPEDSELKLSGRIISRDNKGCVIGDILCEDSGAVFESGKSQSGTDSCFEIKGRILVRFNEVPPEIKIGRRAVFSGRFKTFQSATNPGQFDAADYYLSKKIIGSLKDPVLISFSEKYDPVSEGLSLARSRWSVRIYSVFPEVEASILCDLLLGEKSGIDEDIKDLYTRNGIAHILSISGLHVSILGMSLYMLLKKTGIPTWVCGMFSGFFLVLYAVMTGMSISTLRAVIMFLLMVGADVFGRTEDRATSLSITAVILLIPDISVLSSCGYLLSFGSAAGMCFLSPVLYKAFRISAVKKPFRGLVSSLIASLSITLTTLPVILVFFYEYPVYSILLNLIILPLMTMLVLSAFLSMLIPGAGIMGTPAYLILKFYEFICRLFDRLPFHTWNPGKPGVIFVIVYYALWLFVVLLPRIPFSTTGRFGKLPVKCPKMCPVLSRLIGFLFKDPTLTLTVIIIVIMPLLFIYPRVPRNTLIMLDVGQGDGMIYYTDDREVYLIDGGSSSQNKVGKYVIKPALKYFGLSEISSVFVSHYDNDHISGLLEILENGDNWGISIGRVIVPGYGDGGLHNSDELCVPVGLHNSSTTLTYITAGDEWHSGRNHFICLHPSADFVPEGDNEISECIFVSFFEDQPHLSMLLTGDIEGKGELALTEKLKKLPDIFLPLTILKVAHHGSRGSSSPDFISLSSPRIALISAGRNNRYGHPHKETIDRLENEKSRILSTTESGAIMLTVSKKGGVRVRTFI